MAYNPNRYVPGSPGVRTPGTGQPGVSYTPGPGMMMGRNAQNQSSGGGVDGLKRQLAQLMSDMAMAQATGKSPRHIAEIQGKIYALQLEIQIAQENESNTMSWLSDMAGVARAHSTRPYENLPGGG